MDIDEAKDRIDAIIIKHEVSPQEKTDTFLDILSIIDEHINKKRRI